MVVDDPAAVGDLLRNGCNLVLLVEPGADHVACPDFGPGRLAMLIGPAADPLVRAAADQMSAELFGPP